MRRSLASDEFAYHIAPSWFVSDTFYLTKIDPRFPGIHIASKSGFSRTPNAPIIVERRFSRFTSKYIVLDGQNRVEYARKHAVSSIPAYVGNKALDVIEEATEWAKNQKK